VSWWLVMVVPLTAGVIWWWRARYTRGVTADQLLGEISGFLGYAGFASVLDVEVEGSQALIQVAMRGDPLHRPELEFGVSNDNYFCRTDDN